MSQSYANAAAFRHALETRIRTLAEERGVQIWFAILITLVQSRAGDGLALALRVAQATHESLLLGDRSVADRSVIADQQLVDRWRYWCNRSLARVRKLGEPRLLALFTEILRLTRRAA